TPVSSLLTRILLPSGENDAPRMVVVPRNSSIVYCRTSRGRSSGTPAHAPKRMSEARSAGARVRTIILGLPVGVDPVALCGGLPTAVARGGFLVRCHAERTRGSHRDAEFHLTRS